MEGRCPVQQAQQARRRPAGKAAGSGPSLSKFKTCEDELRIDGFALFAKSLALECTELGFSYLPLTTRWYINCKFPSVKPCLESTRGDGDCAWDRNAAPCRPGGIPWLSVCVCLGALWTVSLETVAAQVLESQTAEATIARSLITAVTAPGTAPNDELGVAGIRLEGVSVFTGYSSNALPGSGFLRIGNLTSGLGSDVDYGGQATFRWSRNRLGTAFGLVYTPRYIARARFPEWNRTDHDVSLSIDTALSPRWDLAFNANAGLYGSEQFFFDPAVFRRVPNPPATLPDLVTGITAGEFSDEEIASILTGAPILDSPGGRDLDLSRTFSASAGVSARYARSSRLSINFGASASRYELLSGRRTLGSTDERLFFPGASTVGGNSGFSYRVSGRTTLGANVNVSQSFSDLVSRGTYVSERMFWSRRLSQRWSAGLQAGHGVSNLSTGGANISSNGAFHTWVAGGNVGYSGGETSLTVSANRNVGDSFGLGARTSTSTGVTWTWHPRGRLWSFDASVAGVVSPIPGYQSLSTWTSTVGHDRVLNNNTVARWEYSYGDFSSQFVGLLSNLTRHRVQFSLTWVPSRRAGTPH